MNVLIPHSWLKDYIETDLEPNEIARLLSLHAFNVERISLTDDGDAIYEIEITPNRGDALSVIGIARELRAIFSKENKKSAWHQKIYEPAEVKNISDELIVDIKDKSLVPRFSAVVLDNVVIKDSPKFIKERLKKIGIRPISNVVDITNYMMIDKGQPMHSFDFDKIAKHTMVVRESFDGEQVTTLDGVKRKLPTGVIVIEDGDKKLIDLCGIMGGENSEIDENTKKVLLFVQEYDPVRIRKASMTLGHRTDAAVRFEKGIDNQGIIPSLWQAVNMINEYAGSNVSSELTDIVNVKYEPKEIEVDMAKISQVAGIEIDPESTHQTLTNLGFTINKNKVLVPSWRYNDIDTVEDLAEEVIRLFGYYNIPDRIPATDLSFNADNQQFYWENVIKTYLKFQGFFECYTYSATTKDKAGTGALKISNPLSEDLKYLKQSLVPQLVEVIDKNQSYDETIKVYELAAVYTPQENDLPKQPYKLALAVKNIKKLVFKGIIEALFDEMGIKEYPVYVIDEDKDGYLTIELDMESLIKLSSKTKSYTSITSFNFIKEDITLVVPLDIDYQDVKKLILSVDKRIVKLKFKDIYQNNLTLSLEYLDYEKQISSDDTQLIRKKIFDKLESELNIKLKG
jgi:phenylalanyl-tRNA synthetase beta chain